MCMWVAIFSADPPWCVWQAGFMAVRSLTLRWFMMTDEVADTPDR